MTSRRVIVVGGSVGGLFAGVLLHHAGWQVVIYERSVAGLGGKGAGLVPQPEVSQILAEIGREDVLNAGVLARERIILDRQGRIVQTIHTPQSQMSWDLLYEAFRSQIPENCYRRGVRIVSAASNDDAATITLQDGFVDSADLVIGADGISSIVRGAVVPGTVPQYAGYVAFRGLASETNMPRESSDLLRGRFAFYHAHQMQWLGYLVAGPDGDVVPGRRRYNWVWYRVLTKEELASALTTKSGEGRRYSLAAGTMSATTRNELARSAEAQLPRVCASLVEEEPQSFVQAIFDYQAPSMIRGRIALLGDAAFIVRPHTAMGVSKAAGDAMTLRDCLLQARSVPEALSAYEALRLQIGRQIARYGQQLGACFGPNV